MDGWAWGRQPTTLWKNWLQTSGLLLRPAHLTGPNRFLSKLGASCVSRFFFPGPWTIVRVFLMTPYVDTVPFFLLVLLLAGLLRTTPHIPMAMSHGRASISLTGGFATSMEYPTSIPLLWVKPLDFVFQLSRPDAWASGGIVNITVSPSLFSSPL